MVLTIKYREQLLHSHQVFQLDKQHSYVSFLMLLLVAEQAVVHQVAVMICPIAGGTMSGSILVDTDNAYDLGSSTKQWRTIYGHDVEATYADPAERYATDALQCWYCCSIRWRGRNYSNKSRSRCISCRYYFRCSHLK